MPYIFAIITAVSFASGFGVSYQISKAEIQRMTDGIAAQNIEATLTLKALTEQADKEHEKALNVTQQLEAANVSTINAINSQRDAFRSKRLYDTHRSRSSCTAKKPSDSSVTINAAADDGRLSDKLTEFLKSEAYRADEVSAYALLCNQFIKGNNHD
jgi:type IV secretory pathway VirJ component